MTDGQYIKEAAEELDFKLDPEYSGRGMMGRSCIAIEIPNFTDMGRIMFHLGAVNQAPEVNMTEQVFEYRYDQMGRSGYIMYWPNIEAPETEEEQEEEEIDEPS